MTQKDGMGREVGGGFRMGNTCTPVADSCLCMAKPIQYSKVKKKKNKKKNCNNNNKKRDILFADYLAGNISYTIYQQTGAF